MTPASIGRIVHYTLTAEDAEAINRRRSDFRAFTQKHQTLGSGHTVPEGELGRSGHVGHIGNETREGEVCPAMVVRVFAPETVYANLKVFLDGNDTYWAGSRTEGEGPGHWAWPLRV